MEIDINWATDCLKNIKNHSEIFKAFHFFELTDPAEFLKVMDDGLNDFDTTTGQIGRLLYENSEKYPCIFAAMFYTTAQNCYFTEMHPAAVDHHMLYYITEVPYRTRSVIDYFLSRKKYVLSFIDEEEYGIQYEPASNYKINPTCSYVSTSL